MIRNYKLFKVNDRNQEKLVKIFPNIQEATLKIRNILGLREFQKCSFKRLYDGVAVIAWEFKKDGKDIFRIRKELIYDA